MQTLNELIDAAKKRYDALTPEQKREHDEAQRRSFVRGMTARCEHGVIDFEQCAECRR